MKYKGLYLASLDYISVVVRCFHATSSLSFVICTSLLCPKDDVYCFFFLYRVVSTGISLPSILVWAEGDGVAFDLFAK